MFGIARHRVYQYLVIIPGSECPGINLTRAARWQLPRLSPTHHHVTSRCWRQPNRLVQECVLDVGELEWSRLAVLPWFRNIMFAQLINVHRNYLTYRGIPTLIPRSWTRPGISYPHTEAALIPPEERQSCWWSVAGRVCQSAVCPQSRNLDMGGFTVIHSLNVQIECIIQSPESGAVTTRAALWCTELLPSRC